MGPGSTCVIQVTNIAPTVSNEQLRTLFTHVGIIREFVVYPTDQTQQIVRVCYVRFTDPMSVCVAQHLTNTVFIDRAIMVKSVSDNRIPDESMALRLANEGHSQNSSNSGMVSQIETVNGVQAITTIDPRLNALGLPQYPPLSPSLDPSKIEEIRRTVIVSNVNKQTTPEQLLDFFNQFGEVKYLRMTTDEHDVIKSAMIEFTDQSSVANALQNTGVTFHGSQLTIAHSTTSILKPQYKINVDPEKYGVVIHPRDLKRRSRSPSYRRSRSPSRSRRSRKSRTPSRRSRERKPRSRSHSPSPFRRRRSRSRDRRDRSPYRRRSRERSYSRERRSRRERSKERERDRDRRRTSRDRSPEKSRSYERDRKRRERSRDNEYDRSVRDRSKERQQRKRRRSRSYETDTRSKDKHRSAGGSSNSRHDKESAGGRIDPRLERSLSNDSLTNKIKVMKSPIIPDKKDVEPQSPIEDFDMDEGGLKLQKSSMMDIENTSVKSDELELRSQISESSPPMATSNNGSTGSKSSHHHRSSKHKHKHQKKSSRDYDSDIELEKTY